MGGYFSQVTDQYYENHAARIAPLMVMKLFGAARVETLATSRKPEKLDALVISAAGDKTITFEKAQELQNMDLVLKVESPEGTTINILAEISITIQQQDLDRAVSRAATLEEATKVRTLPFLIGAHIEEGLDTGETPVLLVPELP